MGVEQDLKMKYNRLVDDVERDSDYFAEQEALGQSRSRRNMLMLFIAIVMCIASAWLFLKSSGFSMHKTGSAKPVFQDVSEERGLKSEVYEKYMGACIADLDRDGRYDLVLNNHGNRTEWYWGKEDGTFEWADNPLHGLDLHGFAAADMDGDGYLDVVAARGGQNGHDIRNGFVAKVESNRMITRVENTEFGLGDVRMRGRAVGFNDFDGDGKLDLIYVNNLHGPDYLQHLVYRNVGGGQFELKENVGFDKVPGRWFRFIDPNEDGRVDILLMGLPQVWLFMADPDTPFKWVDKTDEMLPGGKKMAWARSAAEIDFDGDGDLDLYITRMVPSEDAVRDDALYELRNGKYVDVTKKHNLKLGGRHIGVTNGDFNNDGHMDLLLTRRRVVGKKSVEMPNDLLLLNNGKGDFKHVEIPGTKDFDRDGQEVWSDAEIAIDFDMDGRLDFLRSDNPGKWYLFRNVMDMPRSGANWAIIRVGTPDGVEKDSPQFRHALGAIVQVHCEGHVITQRVGSPGSAHHQSYMDMLHFGLGKCKQIDEINVKYSMGVEQNKKGPFKVNSIFDVGEYPYMTEEE